MAFFEYNQNNSGGSFDVTDTVCHRLFIEADSFNAANVKAEELGVYFYGVSEGRDCDCCGDRWSPPWEPLAMPYAYGAFTQSEAERIAKKYNLECRLAKKPFGKDGTHEIVLEPIEKYAQYMADEYGWTSPDCRIFYANGTVKDIYSEKDSKADKRKQ